MSLEYGKGWGEGEIIEYAINHSKILNKSTRFYKVTGRLFVENFTQIHATYTKYPNLFRLKEYQEEDNLLSLSSILLLTKWNINRYLFSQPHSNFVLRKLNKLKVAYFEKLVYTEFFKADVNFFKKNLLKSYKRVNERQNYFLEHVYYDDLIKKHMVTFLQENINMVGQFTLLNIVGTSASSGHLYSSDYSNEIKEIAKEFI
ncbi:MAG: hypothetical protein JO235_25510 [Chroococcidiopsidaceae cyanobacterium CP_BM_RX_35]|nr:hypothetical protein [Chroococcidiopsidaceae cyanobacterium CP_BM_RX_35]